MIKFNKKIYESGVIKQAIKDYKQYANIKLSEGRSYFFVNIKAKKSGSAIIYKNEFCNYVLGLGRIDHKDLNL